MGNWPAWHDLSCWLGRKTSTQTNKQSRLGGCPGWSESSLGAHVILLVLLCGGSNGNAQTEMQVNPLSHKQHGIENVRCTSIMWQNQRYNKNGAAEPDMLVHKFRLISIFVVWTCHFVHFAVPKLFMSIITVDAMPPSEITHQYSGYVVWQRSCFPWSCYQTTAGMSLCYMYIIISHHHFLAHQTRFSAIFTSADKSYLTYRYPTRGIDKKCITTRDVNTLVV